MPLESPCPLTPPLAVNFTARNCCSSHGVEEGDVLALSPTSLLADMGREQITVSEFSLSSICAGNRCSEQLLVKELLLKNRQAHSGKNGGWFPCVVGLNSLCSALNFNHEQGDQAGLSFLKTLLCEEL